MPDLIAQGPGPNHRWRRRLIEGEPVGLGRESPRFAVPWDSHISRLHAELLWSDPWLQISRVDQARNPIFFQGREQERFEIQVGEHFVIGSTTFTLADEPVDLTVEAPSPVTEHSYSHQFLREYRYQDADKRIAVLSQLPEVISSASNDVDLFVQLVNILLSGIRRATAIAIVEVKEDAAVASHVEVLHWDRRLLSGHPFQPSERLIRQAVETRQSVLHIWSGDKSREGSSNFTMTSDGDWAFATPLQSKSCRGWAIYITGGDGGLPGENPSSTSETNRNDLRDDIKFTELVASTVASLRQVTMLERRETTLRQFFSPVVLEVLAERDAGIALKPREADVSVLFCDLRGFSRTSEEEADDLLGLLDRVSRALGVTTHHILDNGGVVGDFHGDAAMGFWGWPLESDESVLQATRAALGIRQELMDASHGSNHPLSNFRLGMGIATGRGVAGKIGTKDQVKVTVFGPVVNLAARLESMTRQLHAHILLDERSAEIINATAPATLARTRRVAKVLPYGLKSPLVVTELLPPEDKYSVLLDVHIRAYESALDALIAGDWNEAFQWLHKVPADDRVKDYLTVLIARHDRRPPENWDGVIRFLEK